MKASTVKALEEINRSFYSRRASEFSETRTQPWPGWQRVLELVLDLVDRPRISVLDLGCGNGRFRAELEPALASSSLEASYLGLDASWPLLMRASGAVSAGLSPMPRWVAADLAGQPLAEIHPDQSFDLIVNFGLMHHVASHRARRRLLEVSAGRLREGGIVAVSFWQFGDRDRFKRRFLPWSDLDRRPALSRMPIDPGDLEAGDHLLAWGDEGAVRYCHHVDEAEAKALVEGLGLDELASFRDDGGSRDLNLYKVLRRPCPWT